MCKSAPQPRNGVAAEAAWQGQQSGWLLVGGHPCYLTENLACVAAGLGVPVLTTGQGQRVCRESCGDTAPSAHPDGASEDGSKAQPGEPRVSLVLLTGTKTAASEAHPSTDGEPTGQRLTGRALPLTVVSTGRGPAALPGLSLPRRGTTGCGKLLPCSWP